LGKFDAYKIDLKSMQADFVSYKFLLGNVFFVNIDSPEVQKGKANVELLVKKTLPYVFELDFRISGIVWVPCDCCLDEIEQTIEVSDKLMVKLGREYAEENDLIIIPEEEGVINVAWFMYEFITLAIPMKHIHPPGKCNKTMTVKLQKHLRTIGNEEDDNDEVDLSVEAEDMETETQIDPRWNDLKNILDNN
jgi:uncharacterized metal-binding protein YceD (DUF177 family)